MAVKRREETALSDWLLTVQCCPVFLQHIQKDIPGIGSQSFLVFFGKLIGINGAAVFYDHFAGLDLWKMCFKQFCRVGNGNGNNRASCSDCDFKASFMEGEKIQFAAGFISGAFRKDTDGNSLFYLVDGSQNGFHTFFKIFPVQKQTVKIFHPGREKGNGLHLFFCHIAGQVRTKDIGQKDIEVASVVSDVEDGLVFWHVLMPFDRDLCPGHFQDNTEDGLDDPQGTDILCPFAEHAHDPFSNEDRNGQNQVSDDTDTYNDKTKHSSHPLYKEFISSGGSQCHIYRTVYKTQNIKFLTAAFTCREQN